MKRSPTDRRIHRTGAKSLLVCVLLICASVISRSAANAVELQPVYQASLTSGSLVPSVDLLGFGAAQPGFGVASSNPTFVPSSEGTTIGLTRPTVPAIVGPVGAGLFVTPVSFGQGSVFALQATFVAPNGPHNIGDVWATTVGARTGDQDDLDIETRVAATFQVRADGARLNVVGATAPANQSNLPQNVYDSIFDVSNPQPFTLYLLVNRTTGSGTARLTVGSFTTAVDFLLASFQANAGPTITAVGPSLAISSPPGQSAHVTVRDFLIFSAVPEPGTWAMMLIGFAASGLALRAVRQPLPESS